MTILELDRKRSLVKVDNSPDPLELQLEQALQSVQGGTSEDLVREIATFARDMATKVFQYSNRATGIILIRDRVASELTIRAITVLDDIPPEDVVTTGYGALNNVLRPFRQSHLPYIRAGVVVSPVVRGNGTDSEFVKRYTDGDGQFLGAIYRLGNGDNAIPGNEPPRLPDTLNPSDPLLSHQTRARVRIMR